MIRYALYIIFIAILATGCAAQQGPIVTLDPAAPCEDIIHPSLLSVPFDDLAQGQAQTEEWILTQFPTATIDFSPSPTSGGDELGLFSLQADEKLVSLYFWNGTRYAFHRYEKYPTLGHIFRCFGEPEYYTLGNAFIGGEVPSAVRLDLWYPNRGLYFNSVTWGGAEMRRYDVNSPLIGQVRIMSPGTVEEMMKNGGISTEGYHTKADALLREWPEDFTELVLEE